MKRTIYSKLLQWKNSSRRKPLLLQGARQVGKTFLINEFGKNEYDDFIYLNFEEMPRLKMLFADGLSPDVIMKKLSLHQGYRVKASGTLICFDEIQAIPEAITSLKYFHEKAPEYHVIAAGSLLGVSVGKTSSFPVGKVNFLTMYPMNFFEYLTAFGEDFLVEELRNNDYTNSFPEIIHEKLLSNLKLYLYLGGMPEVLQDFIDNEDIASARNIQNEILDAYQRDFSKHTTKPQAIKTAELWSSIPYQLARENKKFKYNDIQKNARSSQFEGTIEWLKKAGLIHLVYHIRTPKIPLAGYADYSKFKIYLHDTGLLGAMLNLSSEIIIDPTRLYTEYHGAFIENFVANELIAEGINKLFYWTSRKAEVDFVIQLRNDIYPVEVKSGMSRTLKSIRSYEAKYQPKYICRISPRVFRRDNEFINIPLYAASVLERILLR